MLLEGPINMFSFYTTSRKNSFLLYFMPYGRHETTFDICVGMFVGALVFFEENGFVNW